MKAKQLISSISSSVSFLALLFTIGLVVGACSEYNKVLKGDDYNNKFDLANTLYDGKDYFRSIALYEQIYQRMPKTGQGELAYYRIGRGYFEEEDYEMSGYYFGSFNQRFPYSTKLEEALFLTALCSVYNSPDHTLDQGETQIAINNLQQFVDVYPKSSLIDSCNRVMDRLRYKLELKDFDAVKLYAKTENYRAAVTTALTFLEEYPLSEFVEMVHLILVKNSYLLGVNSVDDKKCERIEQAMERYRNFVNLFPQSAFKPEADQVNERAQKEWELSCSKKN
jgi:outer membrane protein assembly factor BamD